MFFFPLLISKHVVCLLLDLNDSVVFGQWFRHDCKTSEWAHPNMWRTILLLTSGRQQSETTADLPWRRRRRSGGEGGGGRVRTNRDRAEKRKEECKKKKKVLNKSHKLSCVLGVTAAKSPDAAVWFPTPGCFHHSHTTLLEESTLAARLALNGFTGVCYRSGRALLFPLDPCSWEEPSVRGSWCKMSLWEKKINNNRRRRSHGRQKDFQRCGSGFGIPLHFHRFHHMRKHWSKSDFRYLPPPHQSVQNSFPAASYLLLKVFRGCRSQFYSLNSFLVSVLLGSSCLRRLMLNQYSATLHAFALFVR